eukprot:scaffold120975_cov66-Phaeocystis_antarctica.AAC.4
MPLPGEGAGWPFFAGLVPPLARARSALPHAAPPPVACARSVLPPGAPWCAHALLAVRTSRAAYDSADLRSRTAGSIPCWGPRQITRGPQVAAAERAASRRATNR